jgi:hypothetical protein
MKKNDGPTNPVDGTDEREWIGGLRGVNRNEAKRAALPAGAEYCGRAQAAWMGACQGFGAVWGRLFSEIGCSLNEFLPEGINARGIGVRSVLR